MANHKSAKKRHRQTIKKTQVNRILLSKVKTIFNQLKVSIKEKKPEDSIVFLKKFNSVLSKAVKKRIIKKNNVSRQLSSVMMSIKKIS
jgi:small subunit ribosomal protein S20